MVGQGKEARRVCWHKWSGRRYDGGSRTRWHAPSSVRSETAGRSCFGSRALGPVTDSHNRLAVWIAGSGCSASSSSTLQGSSLLERSKP